MAVQPAYIWTPQGQIQRGRGLQMHLAHNTRDLFAIMQQVLDTQPHPAGPLAPEIVGIQSRGMERWLQRELAAQQGIVTNMTFPLLRRVLEASAETLQSQDAEPGRAFAERVAGHSALRNLLEPARLRWAVADLLGTDPDRFEAVARYMGSFDGTGACAGDLLLELAERLARLLDAYCLHDPEGMLRCALQGAQAIAVNDTNRHQHWQYALWHDLAQRLQTQHGLASMHALHPALHVAADQAAGATARAERSDLSEIRLHLFGFSYLPDAALQLLYQLARHGAEVVVYSLVVTTELLEDQTRQVTSAGESYQQDQRNPLLSAMGQLSRVQLHALHLDQDYLHLPLQTGSEGILPRVQQDLADVQAPVVIECDPADQGVEIHSCYSPLREVEALRDRLVHLLSDPAHAVEPEDILVMCPAIQEYAPYIHAVFSEPVEVQGQERRLPFQVAEQAPGDTEPHTRAILDLLQILDSRVTITDWLNLLDTEVVRTRFGLDQDSVQLARDTLQQNHVHWGLDASHRQAQAGMEASDGNRHTLDYGLQRLALARVLAPDDRQIVREGHGIWRGQTPASVSLAGAVALEPLFALYEFVLARYRQTDTPRTVQRWISWTRDEILLPLIGDSPDPDLQTIAANWQQLLVRLSEMADTSTTALSYRSYLRVLREQLDAMAPGRRFLGGGITFAHLTPIRTIPAGTVVLLGMDYTRFPRQTPRDEFDLLGHETPDSSRWRPDAMVQDRHLFLEALMSARQHFWIYYTGHDRIKNEAIPPAGPVQELQQALVRYAPDRRWIFDHPLHPFGATSFARQTAADRPRLSGVQQSWFRTTHSLLSAAQTPAGHRPWLAPVAQTEPATQTVSLPQLVRALQNPGQYWLQRQLGLQLADQGQPDDEESFSIDSLGRWQVMDWLVRHMVEDLETPLPGVHTILAMQAARGQQPLHRNVATEVQAAHRRASWLQGYLRERVHHQVRTHITLDGALTVQGQLTFWEDRQGHRYFLLASGLDKGKYIVQHWLYHLLLQSQSQAATHVVSPYDPRLPCMHFIPDCPGVVALAEARKMAAMLAQPAVMALSHPGQLWKHWQGLSDPLRQQQLQSVNSYIDGALAYMDAAESAYLQAWLLQQLQTRAQLDALAVDWFGSIATLSRWQEGYYHG